MLFYCIIGLLIYLLIDVIDLCVDPEGRFTDKVKELKMSDRFILMGIIIVLYMLFWPVIMIANIILIIKWMTE